jgi:hypothetical protein
MEASHLEFPRVIASAEHFKESVFDSVLLVTRVNRYMLRKSADTVAFLMVFGQAVAGQSQGLSISIANERMGGAGFRPHAATLCTQAR